MTPHGNLHLSHETAVEVMRGALIDDFTALLDRLEAIEAGKPAPPFVATEGSRLQALASIFRLTPSEQQLVCLAAGVELDTRVTAAVTAVTGSERADVTLATKLVPDALEAFTPDAPLRRWRLIELPGTGPFPRRSLTLDERILHFLLGNASLDGRLEGIVRVVSGSPDLNPREQALGEQIARGWVQTEAWPVLLLGGPDPVVKRKILANVTSLLKFTLFRVDAKDIPGDWTQRHALATFLDREAALTNGAILIECGRDEADPRATQLADLLLGPVAISAPDPEAPEREPRLRFEVPSANPSERRLLWRSALGPKAEALGADLDRLAEQFALDASDVATAASLAVGDPVLAPDAIFDRLWQAAREQSRRRLDGLADRIESTVSWDTLILPGEQMSVLQDLASHLREAWVVNHSWGWQEKSARGLGAAALFSGASGTGKTLAAEVLAGALKLDLYRIDLSQVVNKYIGETEKNLSRIFTAAEEGGAILLFDEADALFGKRSEVKDSHDRYANVEVSYLLQRMEAYRGLAILTTNQKSAVDQAFLRRLRYLVNFPFPDTKARAAIWRQIFPTQTPLEGLQPENLARMNLSGGSIRSIALNACFLAAARSEPVKTEHILRAARREYAKLEKPFTASELEAFR